MGLLNHIEKEQIDVAYEEGKEPEKVIEMHMYMTAAQGKTDMKGIGLQIALDLMHKKDNRDLITGLQTRTQAGRPNWNQVCTRTLQDVMRLVLHSHVTLLQKSL